MSKALYYSLPVHLTAIQVILVKLGPLASQGWIGRGTVDSLVRGRLLTGFCPLPGPHPVVITGEACPACSPLICHRRGNTLLWKPCSLTFSEQAAACGVLTGHMTRVLKATLLSLGYKLGNKRTNDTKVMQLWAEVQLGLRGSQVQIYWGILVCTPGCCICPVTPG